MQRRTMMIAAMTVTAALAGFVVAGTAFGADWYEYEGRMTAGQAYLIPVPAAADTISFAIVPTGDSPSAKIVLFDPTDARLGYKFLEGESASFDIVDPLKGSYVAYVYEVKQASISVRLQAKDAANLTLLKAETVRADKPIVRGHEGALDKEIQVALKEEPVFATILYKGSVENLIAVAESALGPVVTVTGESGTSYHPGLSIGSASSRDVQLENLARGDYTVQASADRLDGDLYLTTLHYARPAKAEPVVPVAPRPPATALPPVEGVQPEGAPLPHGVPIAVEVAGSDLALALPSAFACTVPVEEDEDNETGGDSPDTSSSQACADREHDDEWWMGPSDGRHYQARERATISVYDGADQLVGVYRLDSDKESVVLLEGLDAGEYVVFVHSHYAGRSESEFAAYLVDAEDPTLPLVHRAVALVKAEQTIASDGSAPYYSTTELEFATAPLGIAAFTGHETASVLQEVRLKSPVGVAFEQWTAARVPYTGDWWWYQSTDLETLVPGSYVFTVDALAHHGEINLAWMTYDRAFAFGEEPAEVEAEDGDAEEDHASAPSPTQIVEDVLARLGI